MRGDLITVDSYNFTANALEEQATETVTIFDAADAGWSAAGVDLTTGATKVGDVTWHGRTSGAIGANNLTFSDGVAWTKYIKTGGGSTFASGSTLGGVLAYTPTKNGTIRVYAKGGGSSARALYISQSITSTNRDETTAIGTSIDGTNNANGIAIAEVEKDKTVYVWATGSMLIYGMTFESEVESSDPAPTPTYPITATWDFQNENPATITSVNYQSAGTKTGTVASDQDGIELYVDATTGKLAYTSDQGGYAQFNNTTVIRVPVNTTSDVVTVVAFPGQFNYTVGGTAATANETEHTATAAEVTAGYVEIVATNQAYLYSISVTQNGPKETPAPERTFVDFKVDFRVKDAGKGTDYTITLPANGELPAGVTIDNYAWNDGTHGATSATITVPVDGPVKFTIGDCTYGQHNMSVKVGSAEPEKIGNGSSCSTETTWIYNNETPATLIFTFTGGYVPYFYAEQCELVKQVTVTYYDANGTSVIGTDVVDGGSALKYKFGMDDVTVASGKKFRSWKNRDGVVVAEGTTLNADLNLYACVTDIEVATKSSEHTYNLTDSKFLQDEHELISVTNGSFHDGQHGWEFSDGGKVTLSLAGNATITVGNCVYPQNGTTKIVAKNATGETFGECNAVVSSDGATSTFIYEGEAGDVTLNIVGGQAYIHNIKVTHTGDLTLPKWDGMKEAWTFTTKKDDVSNAKELLYAISYVNSQSEHTKTLFIPNGNYDLSTTTLTSVPAGMHLIGESQDGVLIKNQPTEESINQTATLKIDGANVTLENMTIKCRAPYGITTGGVASDAERGVCVQDCGNGTHYINVTLDGLQDTYYSNGAAGMSATFDNCIVRGNVDFFCGNGNITVNDSRLQIVTTHTSGGTAIICAPATYTTETQGYLFNNCVVEAATSAVDCVTPGHSNNLKFNLARAWYAGGEATKGLDRTPRVTFQNTEFEITQSADWGGSIGYAQTEERRVFQIINTGVEFSPEAKVIDKTNKPFAYATANDRTDPASVSAGNITGGGEYDLETIMEKMEAGDGYTAGTTKEISTSNGTKKAIVLKSANTTENGKEKRVPMDQTIIDAINNNDIIVLDGAGYSDFVVKSVMAFRKVENKTVVGINGARLCTEWYLTDYFKSILENVPTSSGTGVNSASTAEGTGGPLYDKDGNLIENIKEEGEFLTRKNLYEAVGNEDYRYSGIFYLGACKNWIIRNLKLVGPGSLDCAGYDLMAIIDSDSGTKFSDHMWIDHCEFVDGMDGNFDITNGSDFVTVSWCKFYYSDRSYAHQNTNLVGSSDDKKAMDGGKLNITFAYNEWGANCRARMPMARYGRIHMLNNYYNCAGNSEYAMNPRIESEFLIQGNYWERGVRRAYTQKSASAVTWDSNNYYADNAAAEAGSNFGSTVTVPYQYSAIMLDPRKVPEVVTLNGGAKLYQKPYFTTNLGVADNTDATPELEYTTTLSSCDAEGLTFSVWAENAHTFQWYMQEIALDGTVGEWQMIEGASRNSYTYKPKTGVSFNLYCMAFGVSGKSKSDILKVTIDGESKPIYTLDLDDTKPLNVISGSPQILTVNAGTDGVAYQWYKSANADGSNPTAITGATDRSYTYNPTEAEIVYLFCRATNTQGSTDSKIVKVKGTYRDVKFHMYATYDANANNGVGKSSVFVDGGTSNINNVNSQTANISADGDGCKAEANNADGISGLVFTAGSTDYNPMGIYALLTPSDANAIASGDKIEVSVNTSNSHNGEFGFYVCTANTLGENNANVIGIVTIPAGTGSKLYTETFTASGAITSLYLIPFVKEATKKVNLANVVVYSGDVTIPVDAPAFTKDLEESYEVSQDGALELSIDYDANDVSAVQWYKNTINSSEGGESISGATGKKYSVPTSELGISYYYAVITGKGAFSSETVASTVAKVVVKAKPAGTITYIYDMKNIPGGVTNADQTITAPIEIPANDYPDNTILYTPKDATGSTYKNDGGKNFDDGFVSTSYLKANGKTESKGNHFKIEIDKDDATITVYTRSGGSSARGAIVFDNLSSIPTSADGAILYVSGYENGAAINGYGTTRPLTKGTYYVGVTNNSYIYAIKVTVPEDATAPKEIVHYRMDDESYVAKKELPAELGKIYFGADNRQANGAKDIPEGGIACGYGFRLGNNAQTGNTHYVKVIMPDGMPIQEGDVITIKSWENSGTPSGNTIGFRILSSNEGGVNSEYGILPCTVKATEEEITATVSSTVLANLIGESQFFITRCDGKTVFMSEITITREMKAETECAKPTAKKETWNEAEETWNYTISSSTPTAVIHYQVNDGEEVVASVAPKNSVAVAFKPGDDVKAWATDSQSKIEDSEVNEFTVPEKAKLTKPTFTVGGYSIANKSFPVTITAKAEEGAVIYYTTDGTEPTEASIQYTAAFNHEGGVTIKAIAIKEHWTSSDIVEASVPKFATTGSEKIVMDNGSTSNQPNVGLSYTVDGEWNAATYSGNSGTGLKYRVKTVDVNTFDTDKQKHIVIKANDGFVIRKIESEYAISNSADYSATVAAIYANGDTENDVKAKEVTLEKKGGDATKNVIATKDGLKAKSLDIRFTNTTDAAWIAGLQAQINILFKVYYELDDEIATEGEDIVTINGTPLTTEQLNTLKTTGTVEISEPLYAEDPVILMKSKLGYTYTLENKAYDAETKYNSFQKTFLDHTYTVKVKVNDIKSPTIAIDENLSLSGGYKVTLGAYSPETTPYIKIDDGEWEVYDPARTYYALKTVQSKVGYTEAGGSSETEPRSADCPSNSYIAGKPFAVFVYVNGYADNQVGVHAYNNESLAEDQIYQAISRQFNVVQLPVNNSDAILDKRPDITDAKLVVITESLGGSGSVEIEGVGNKSNMMALTLKRDVLDKTNVLNMKMFLNGSSSANNQRWQWAQPRPMASELTSIVPCTPGDGGMYEVFSTATLSRDGSINLWDDIDTENQLYHLQPVFNFNEENTTLPNFIPLALVIDPEEPEDQREEYHALHFYEKNGFQYAAFGLSLNEWPQYNDNVGAIVEKIGEMIIAGRPLNSKLTGIVEPIIIDNGDGSAKVMNNNLMAETFYKVYTEDEFQSLATANPDKAVTEYVAAQEIINGNQQPDEDFNTHKYTTKMHIFAVSRLGSDAQSKVVYGTVEGNTTRYVIRENDDPAAVGLVAKYPFEVNADGAAKDFNMPYNQSWKKEGYTVTQWVVTKSLDAGYPEGSLLTPGQVVSSLTQDITVKAVWSENTHKITDISSSENEKAMRTVTWEFLQSKGAPAITIENKAGNMQAVLVGQVHFADGTWLDVPMTINTDNNAILPDNSTSYHGKFNNTSTNWAKTLVTTDAGTFTGSDYTQVRTGTQFTFPVIYGSNIVYKQVDLVETTDGKANGNVNRSQISQSYLTDGSKSGNDINYWRMVNPGYELTPGFSGMYLQPNCTVVMTDGVAQLAKTSPLYAIYKASMGAMGYDSQLYDADTEGNEVGGNANYGGLIYYDGEATEATLTSVESANYVHVGAETGKTLGSLNYGSVFMQSLSITYPVLHNLEYEVKPEKSALDGADEPAAVATVVSASHANCDGKYLANEKVEIIVTPSYGYYVSKVPHDDYVFLTQNGTTVTDGITYDGDVDGEGNPIEGIPSEGAKVRMQLNGGKLVFKLLQHPTFKYNAYAEPGLYGNVYFNTGTGRAAELEYNEFPEGKHIILSATPKMGYRFVEWQNKIGDKFVPYSEYNAKSEIERAGFIPFAESVVKGDGTASHKNPFDPERNLADNELDITVAAGNALPSVQEYIAIFEKAEEGTAHYLFNSALLQTDTKDAEGNVIATTYSKLEITDAERRAFPDEFKSSALNVPSYYTLFKEGYTLDRWVQKNAEPTFDGSGNLSNADAALGVPYYIGTYYYYNTENEDRYLIPVFRKNEQSYDYRATSMDITWDFRSAHFAQRVNLPTSDMTPVDVTYYSTHATFNENITVDVPLQITFGDGGRFVNNVIDDWGAFGQGTKIIVPSGIGAKFTLATYAPLNAEPGMGGTNFDGVVPTEYTIREENEMPVYYYTYVTPSAETTVTLTIGSDYSYYKSLRAELPSADAVYLYLASATPEFGDVKLLQVTSTQGEDITNNANKVKRVEGQTFNGLPCQAYTMPLGSHVKVQADRKHYYIIDHVDNAHGENYTDANVHAPTDDEQDITGISADANNLVLDFDIMAYENAVVTYYKLNTLYQINYTSGLEAEGEAPGMMLIESGESFTIPAVNHHLYVDGQTLRYWIDEDGNKYDLGQTYTLGQTFTASKNLPSGITSGNGFTVPEKDLFLSPVFKVNDFTVLNLSNTATATWPLSRLGSADGISYEGNGDIVINYEGINGIYVTQLQVKDKDGDIIDFIDLKMDIRGENGKANNQNSTDRCQINSGTVFGVPSSSNCSFTLNAANYDIKVKVDGGAETSGKPTLTSTYTGDKTQLDINFTGNTYLYEVVAQYNPVSTDLPELDYATVGNISLGAIGTPLANYKLSTLKVDGEVSDVPADLSNSTTGIMPVVRGTATLGGYVEVLQATIDNPVATMLVKTQDGVTVSVYKIGFSITYPNIAPRVTDLKVDRKYQCDLQKMYEKAIEDTRVDGTNYLNDDAYLKHLGVDGTNAANERVGINGVINIKFSTKMAETTIPAAAFQPNGTGKALGQAISSLEGQTLTFTYKGLDVDTEYDFIIPAGTFKDVFWEDAADDKKDVHVYSEPIRLHFTTVETAISIDHRVVNFVVTHNQASHFDVEQGKMVADGEPVLVASKELLANLEAKDIPYGTLDEGVKLANAYAESGKRFYIFVPDGEYQLMGNDVVKSVSSPIGEDGKVVSAIDGKTNVYNGITTISRDNISITGQSQSKTIVYNHPAFEGLSNASTLKLNNGIANFYAQDMTLQNRFDFLRCRKVSSKAVAPVIWDRSQKAIFKNVKFDSYQDTYYTNANNQLDDTRGYVEECTIMGYVDFICGDGDHWFQNSDLVVRQGVGSTATNMFAPRQYDTQQWGFVMNQCSIKAENNTAFEVNDGKMTIARPWANSPASSLIRCTYDVLSTDDGYKKMTGGGLVLRMQEYMSYAADGTPLDLSKRSLRNSSPGIGSYDAVMTPSRAAEYNIFNVMGGEDGYDPTLYTHQRPAPAVSQDDQYLVWDEDPEALCYFVFRSLSENDTTSYQLYTIATDDYRKVRISDNNTKKYYYRVRAANQRGGLGWYSDPIKYEDLGYYDLKAKAIDYTYGDDAVTYEGYTWSTICLPFGASVPEGSWDDVTETVNTENQIRVFAPTEYKNHQLKLERVQHLDSLRGYVVYARPAVTYRFFGSTHPSERVTILDGYAPQYIDILNSNGRPTGEKQPSQEMLDRLQANVNCYTLSYKDAFGIGFYTYKGDYLNPYKAWLDASWVSDTSDSDSGQSSPSSVPVRFVFDDFDMSDDIEAIDDDNNQDSVLIFDLHGHRVQRDQLRQGNIYIIGGKKVMF